MTGARRTEKLARLARLADMVAQAERAKLAAAARAEAEVASRIEALEDRRTSALQILSEAPPTDAPTVRASAAWLRWAEGRRREELMALARARAEAGALRQHAARAVARHEVLKKVIR